MTGRQGMDEMRDTGQRRRRIGALALAVAALAGAAGTTLAPGGTAAASMRSAAATTPDGRHRAVDLAVEVPEVVLVKADGDTRWRGQLTMTVHARTGQAPQTRLTFHLNPGVAVFAAPHPGGDPTGSLAAYGCVDADTGGYSCDLGTLTAGGSTTVRLDVQTDWPGIAFTPQTVTVTALTTDGRPVHDTDPTDNTTQYTTRIA